MVEFKLKANGREETITFPSKYRDLTLRQFIELRRPGNNRVSKILEVLSSPSVPAEIWDNMPEDTDAKVAPCIEFLITDDKVNLEELPIPEEITIKGKTILVPKDLGYKTFGQKSLADDKFKSLFKRSVNKIDPKAKPSFKMVDDPVNIMPDILAIYFQPYFNAEGKFVEEEVELLIESTLEIPFVHAYPVANFFLRKSTASVKLGRQPMKEQIKKLRRRSPGATKKKPGSKR